MNKLAKVILIIGICSTAIGGILCIGSMSTGKVELESVGRSKTQELSQRKYNIEKTEIDAFDKFSIDADAVNLKIVKDDKFAIEYHGYWKPEYKCENGKLTFELKGTHNVSLNEGIRSFLNGQGVNSRLTIYIPADTEFKKGKISADAGNVEVSDISIKDFEVEADAGNVKINSVDVNSGDITVDAGNITVEDSVIKNIKVEADAGNIKLLDMTTDVAKLEASMGNIKVEINGDRNDYDIKVDNSLGNIKVDGSKVKSLKEDTGKAKKIKIENDMGNVKLSFR